MSLFNEDSQESYTELAKELEAELTRALLPIFKKYADQGVKQRELFYCAVQVAQDVQLSALVEADRAPLNRNYGIPAEDAEFLVSKGWVPNDLAVWPCRWNHSSGHSFVHHTQALRIARGQT